MLIIAKGLKEVEFGRLMAVYAEGNEENARDRYGSLPLGQGILAAEQDFYAYLRDVFFRTPAAVCCIWQEEGQYASALRLEPYRDGLLVAALETAPEQRRKGYALRLVQAVQGQYPGAKLYSHVAKGNVPSLGTHEKAGFRRISEQAVYLDGSVNSRCCTLLWQQDKICSAD